MPKQNPKTLELVEPTDQILNTVAFEVGRNEIESPFIQGVIDRMLELAGGKGHNTRFKADGWLSRNATRCR